MTVYFPEGVDAQGNESLLWVPAIADTSAPKLTELTATGAVNVSCAVRGFSPTAEQGTSEDIRLCSTESFENPGRVKNSIDDLDYVYDPQAADGSTTNKHYEVLVQGAKGFLVDRRGFNAQTEALAVGQKVDVYPVTLGAQRRKAVDPSAEGGKFEISQKPFVSGPVAKDAVLVA